MKKIPGSVKAKKSRTPSKSNSLLNITILFLSVIIIYLGYSVLYKLNVFESERVNETTKEHKRIIQVEVLNGCGVVDIADAFTDSLRKRNFDVVNTANYRSFEIDKSIIIDRAGRLGNAKYLADVIGLDRSRVIQQKNKNYFLDITLIVGKDYRKLFHNN
ncbi:MAG: LytR C-terminal domain-containing protein [Ignavibacterium sp.]|nr:MAG: LytR C-terminal domain-containing protein [Ignavibacterium sp.]